MRQVDPTEWYVKIRGDQLGPMSEDALRSMAGLGRITRDAQLWRPGLKEWVSADQVPGIIVPPNPSNSRTQPSPPLDHKDRSSKAPPPKEEFFGATSGMTTPAMSPATPWQRFWPRMLDAWLWVPILGTGLALIAPNMFHAGGLYARKSVAYVQLIIFSMPASLVLDTVVFAIFGNTFGKWLVGVRIISVNGDSVTARRYLQRNLYVYTYGLACGTWIAALFTLGFSYTYAKKNHLLKWDRSLGTRSMATSTNPLRLWIAATLYIVLVIFSDFLQTYASLQ